MELTLKGEPKETAAPLPETRKRRENELDKVAHDLLASVQAAVSSYEFARHTSAKQ